MRESADKAKGLVIESLGTFSVRVGDKILSDNSPRAGQVWRLFKYIITNKSTPIPTEKLIDLLWPDGDVDNPIKALYTLVYRLRVILNERFDVKQEFIIFQHNSYIWNKNADYWFDAEEFESLFREASEPELTNRQRIDLYNRAFSLYHGDYLAESHTEGWVFPATNYYKRVYTSIIIKLSELCAEEADYNSIVKYCERAVEFDPLDENLHATLISALVSQGLVSQALAHYDYIAAMLNTELGVKPSNVLQEVYRNIHKHTVSFQVGDLASIKKELSEGTKAKEAFFCKLDTFVHIYRLEERAIERSEAVMCLALISIVQPNNSIPGDEVLSPAFALLKRVVLFGLRRGDVVTQPSKSQLLLLLPVQAPENCEIVMSRLKDKFYSSYKGEPVRFRYVYEPLGSS
jgi:two-component SAPR family response regulator